MNPEQLIDLSLKSGASHAEVYQSRAFSRPVFFEANRLKQLESSQSEGVALRIWYDNRPGLAVAYGEVPPETLIEKAFALSALNPPEIPELNSSSPVISSQKQEGEILPLETLIEMGKRAICQLRDAYPDILCSGEFECEIDTTFLMNSLGLYGEYADISTHYYLGVEWIRGEDFLGVYDGECTQHQPQPEKIVKQLLKRLEWAQTNSDSPTGKIPILFTTKAAKLLWRTVADALNSKRVIENASPWSNRQGEPVISSQITLFQDPNVVPYNCPFDDEGTASQSLSLITNGVLKQFYSDRKTARQLNLESSGNGFRSDLGTYPTPSLINLMVNQGQGDLEALISTLDEGLIIDQILGGGDDISGDFSVNIDLGYRVEKGQITGRVKDTMVAGNVYAALKQVRQLGEDNRWQGSCYTPSLIVEGLSVVG